MVTLGGIAGCSDKENDMPGFSVGIEAEWNSDPKSQADVGVIYSLVVTQFEQHSQCGAFPPSTEVWANDMSLSLVPSPNDPGCSWAAIKMGPFLKDQDVTVQVREGTRVVAEANYQKLTPGTAAALEGTTGENLHAGDQFVVRPIPDLPGESGLATFYALDEPDWNPYRSTAMPVRMMDGLHITVPAFTGRAIFVVWNTGTYLVPEITCQGFAVCMGKASNALGPFLVSGAP
jgi:hypothetical protein